MRDLLLGAVIAGLVLYGLRAPWVAVLGWTWISMMNPHSFTFGLRDAPVAMVFALSAVIGLAVTREPKGLVWTRETVVLVLFMIWMSITLPVSFTPDAFDMWKRVMKIDFMLLVTLMILRTRQHIVAFAWVVAGSLAFYGIKGGIFTILTGGSARVWGPTGGYIEGNNEIGLALVMTIPLLRYLQGTLSSKWAKHSMTAAMLLCAAAALGTQSRGALLAIASMTLVLWWRGRNKWAGLVIMTAAVIALLTFMPDSWWSRMNTIKTYEEDASATGRLNAWTMAWNLASANFFGGSFDVARPEYFARYAPDPTAIHAAHSIYFMVLGEHGFVGLFLFILLFCLTFASAGRLRKQGLKRPETQWLSDLGAMCQVSLVGYAVGGAFLSLSYWDMPYNIMLLVVMGCQWIDRKQWMTEPAYSGNPFESLMFWRRKPKPKSLSA